MLRFHTCSSFARPTLPLLLLLFGACGGSADTSAAAGPYTPPDSSGPSTPAPTGQKWEGQPSKDRCGRTSWTFTLVDELCGATGAPGYMSALRTPMTRDGTIVGGHLYSVDATHLWVVSLEPGAMREVGRVAGIGQPLSIAQHGGRLVVASGDAGLVILDPSVPHEPTVSFTLPLPGPALDVDVEGDRAVVALGSAGFAVVDLSSVPALVYVKDTPGFAAGAALRGSAVYVADCAALGVFDAADGSPWSYETFAAAAGSGVAAPFRDVEVRDGVAYVAAGRWGVITFDVHDPQAVGTGKFCRIDATTFYASGVRASAGGVFVAGGEWGVMRALPACPPIGKTPPVPLPTDPGGAASGSSDCAQIAPWDVVEWAAATPVPTPKRDPIQVLPTDDRVYAFGEATRLGFRAIDERDLGLDLVRRWEEPLHATAVAARAGRVFVTGRQAALFDVSPEGALTRSTTTFPEEVASATAAGLLPDGRWAFVAKSSLWIEGEATPLDLGGPVFGFGVAETPHGLALAGRGGILELSGATSPPKLSTVNVGTTKLPAAIASAGKVLYFAAPEWEQAARWDGALTLTPPHEVFTRAQAAEVGAWMRGLPRRVLMTAGADLVEVAMLGDMAGITARGRFQGVLSFPREEIVGGVATEDSAYLVATDRKGYTTRLHTVRLDDPPAIVATEAWLGQGMGIARSDDRLYVADANGTLRVFGLGSKPTQLQVITLGEAP